MKARDKISMQFLLECFEYRDGVLYWRERPAHHFQRPADHATFIKKSAGKPAGRSEPNGYLCVKMRLAGHPVCISVHRIVWAMHHGRWPDNHVDHINRARKDNRIENLRDVPCAVNARNSARNNVYPYVGRYSASSDKFSAQVRIGDKGVHLGVFDSEEEAHAHRTMVNGALEKLARKLAKKSPIGRPRKTDNQTFSSSSTGGVESE